MRRPYFHTYVRRVCSSKQGQLVLNLWAGHAEGKSILALEELWRAV